MGKKDYFEKNENAEEISFENFMKKNGHAIKRTVKIILLGIAVLVLAGNSCSIVQQRERGSISSAK